MALNVSTFVDITTRISAGGVPRGQFGRGLLVTVDDTLAAGGSGKVQVFADNNAVTDTFSGDLADDAAVWFSADSPAKALYVGRWANAAVGTTLRGGTPAAVGTFTAANSTFVLNGNTVTVDLSSVSTFTAVATAIQTAIQAVTGFSTATFAYDTDAFLLTLADETAITDGVLADTASVSDTDIAASLGMAAASSPTYKLGSTAETIQAALTAMIALATGGEPVAIMLASDILDLAVADATQQAATAYAQAGDYIGGLLDTDTQALVANDTTSLSAQAFDLNQGQVSTLYSEPDARPDIALLALMSSQNLGQPASLLSPHAKALPGATTSDVSPSQHEELERKRVNVYTTVGGVASLVGGYTSRAGYWLDASWWLLWIKSELELAVWNAMRGSRRLTNAILQDELTSVLESGVRNGGIQPGRSVDAPTKSDIISTTGNEEFDGTLTSGYLVWIQPDSARTDSDRSNRLGRFKVWASGSEAIHEVLGDLVFVG